MAEDREISDSSTEQQPGLAIDPVSQPLTRETPLETLVAEGKRVTKRFAARSRGDFYDLIRHIEVLWWLRMGNHRQRANGDWVGLSGDEFLEQAELAGISKTDAKRARHLFPYRERIIKWGEDESEIDGRRRGLQFGYYPSLPDIIKRYPAEAIKRKKTADPAKAEAEAKAAKAARNQTCEMLSAENLKLYDENKELKASLAAEQAALEAERAARQAAEDELAKQRAAREDDREFFEARIAELTAAKADDKERSQPELIDPETARRIDQFLDCPLPDDLQARISAAMRAFNTLLTIDEFNARESVAWTRNMVQTQNPADKDHTRQMTRLFAPKTARGILDEADNMRPDEPEHDPEFEPEPDPEPDEPDEMDGDHPEVARDIMGMAWQWAGENRARTHKLGTPKLTVSTIKNIERDHKHLYQTAGAISRGRRIRADFPSWANMNRRSVPRKLEEADWDFWINQDGRNRDDIFLSLFSGGTPQMDAVLPMMLEKSVPSVFPSTCARSMYLPFNKYKYGQFSSYYDQQRSCVKYFAEKKGKKVFGSMYEDTDFGRDIHAGLVDQIKEMGLKLGAVATFAPTASDFNAHVTRIAEAECDLVSMGTIVKDTILILQTARKMGYKPDFCGQFASYSTAVAEAPGSPAQGFYSMSPGLIAYADDPRPAVREVLTRYKQRFGIDINYLGEAAYAAATCTIEALQRAGRDLNLDTFQASMEQTKNWRDIFGGPPLTITATDHHASTQSFLSVVSKGRWTPVVQEPLSYS